MLYLIIYFILEGASEKFNEETSKSKCKRFFSGQNCAFGANCIFSHKTEPELENLKREGLFLSFVKKISYKVKL